MTAGDIMNHRKTEGGENLKMSEKKCEGAERAEDALMGAAAPAAMGALRSVGSRAHGVSRRRAHGLLDGGDRRSVPDGVPNFGRRSGQPSSQGPAISSSGVRGPCVEKTVGCRDQSIACRHLGNSVTWSCKRAAADEGRSRRIKEISPCTMLGKQDGFLAIATALWPHAGVDQRGGLSCKRSARCGFHLVASASIAALNDSEGQMCMTHGAAKSIITSKKEGAEFIYSHDIYRRAREPSEHAMKRYLGWNALSASGVSLRVGVRGDVRCREMVHCSRSGRRVKMKKLDGQKECEWIVGGLIGVTRNRRRGTSL
ncbi:hypothetical protein FB451DRAFT_1188184 [Mycena latifolia]|nr:hypothetical protein FB451DRAFT_1188184 [Mycena latifolia]